MVAQIEGFKHEQLLFVDEVLKQLGEYQPTKKKSRTQWPEKPPLSTLQAALLQRRRESVGRLFFRQRTPSNSETLF